MEQILNDVEAAEILTSIALGNPIKDDGGETVAVPSPKERLDAIKLMRAEGWIKTTGKFEEGED